jgi:hypothetical protein
VPSFFSQRGLGDGSAARASDLCVGNVSHSACEHCSEPGQVVLAQEGKTRTRVKWGGGRGVAVGNGTVTQAGNTQGAPLALPSEGSHQRPTLTLLLRSHSQQKRE